MTKTKLFYGWILGFIFVLAIAARCYAYYSCNAFEDDECRLILAFLEQSWSNWFLNLGADQQGPPVFVLFTKAWGYLFGFNETTMRIPCLINSLASIFFFYKLTTKIFTKKIPILVANFLFAINLHVILFAARIKQYSGDVLIGIICCLIFSKLDLTNVSKRQLIFLGVVLPLLPLISLPSLFYIGAFFIINLIKNYKNKVFYPRFISLLVPFLLVLIAYYLLNLAPARQDFAILFPTYWENGLIGFSINKFLYCQKLLFQYLFAPNAYTIITVILLYSGIYFLWKEKTDLSKFLLVTLGLILLASILKLYPLENRVALHVAPILIMIFTKPLEKFHFKNIALYFFIICFLFTFKKYFSIYGLFIFSPEAYINYSPNILIQELKENFNPKKDIVLTNHASASSYVFYSGKYKFDNKEIYEIPIYKDPSKEELLDYLNNLDANKNYWFYLIKDFVREPIFPILLEWISTQNILKEYHDKESHLYLIDKL